MPGLDVIRPADANETAVAVAQAVARTSGPTALVLTRQDVPVLDRTDLAPAAGLERGGYVLTDAEGEPEVILIGTGSEVELALEAHSILTEEGIRSRVVSLPCWELFERQEQAYRDEVLPPAVSARVAVEQASPLGWERWVGSTGEIIAMQGFGASAPFSDLRTHFGFTPEAVVEAAKRQLRLAG